MTFLVLLSLLSGIPGNLMVPRTKYFENRQPLFQTILNIVARIIPQCIMYARPADRNDRYLCARLPFAITITGQRSLSCLVLISGTCHSPTVLRARAQTSNARVSDNVRQRKQENKTMFTFFFGPFILDPDRYDIGTCISVTKMCFLAYFSYVVDHFS